MSLSRILAPVTNFFKPPAMPEHAREIPNLPAYASQEPVYAGSTRTTTAYNQLVADLGGRSSSRSPIDRNWLRPPLSPTDTAVSALSYMRHVGVAPVSDPGSGAQSYELTVQGVDRIADYVDSLRFYQDQLASVSGLDRIARVMSAAAQWTTQFASAAVMAAKSRNWDDIVGGLGRTDVVDEVAHVLPYKFTDREGAIPITGSLSMNARGTVSGGLTGALLASGLDFATLQRETAASTIHVWEEAVRTFLTGRRREPVGTISTEHTYELNGGDSYSSPRLTVRVRVAGGG